MKRSYHEIMDHIQLSDEARRRILHNLESADLKPAPRSKVVPFRWRRAAALAACLALVLVGTSVWRSSPAQNPSDPGSSSTVLGPSEMDVMPDRAALEQALGFPVEEIAALPFPVKSVEYLNCWDNYAQITYSGDGQEALFRKAPGTDDISGDYNVYPAETVCSVSDWSVTLKGEDDRFVLAVWTDGDFAYALSLSEGVSAAEWQTILRSIQD